jgi:hypothetical protein
VSNSDRTYCILFDDLEEISKIQKLYKKYEQIINDVEYDIKNDRIIINNLSSDRFVYVS